MSNLLACNFPCADLVKLARQCNYQEGGYWLLLIALDLPSHLQSAADTQSDLRPHACASFLYALQHQLCQ